ncbi:inositol monophosphatase [Thioploca ingrica]|uniref:3'(2'),5'-bisphosphate nucleotidase CysQ n=1 Tax=Thioploca ingrica TaxID=40754 RepID=A0A090BUY8_9GAMM|nr:inositol monophosphatase [Thioploca ingrica]
MPNDFDMTALLATVNQLAQLAGKQIMEIYETDFDVEHKDDKSPLTKADMAAHNTIVKGLQETVPRWPILSEESASIPYEERAQWPCYWLVDPLDGTREFIKRNGEFTVNIALIENHQPILGVVYVPATGVTYFAAVGQGAFKWLPKQSPKPIRARSCPQDRLTIAGSRSHAGQSLQKFIEGLGVEIELVSIGSSLKSCLVAEGKVDIYPRFGPTSEWDTAAAQCVVEQAGGYLTDTQLQPLRYNTKESLINPYFLVFGDKRKDWSHHLAQAMPLNS